MITLRQLLCWIALIHTYPESIAGPLNPKWKAFIAADVLQSYIGKDQNARFSSDLFEGDIMGIDVGSADEDIQSKIKDVYKDKTIRWESGLVHYKISDKFTRQERRVVENALEATSAATDNCIRFVPQTLETDYINFIRGFSCFSSIGFQSGIQLISLHPGCLESGGLIQHLLMHTLGFYHENARLDRDQFIALNGENIATPARDEDFKKYVDVRSADFPYDLESITHYPFNVFAVDPNLPTIIPKKRASRIGQTDGLSDQDVAKVRRAYGCNKPTRSTLKTTTTTTPDPLLAVTGGDNILANITPDQPDDASTTDSTMKHPVFRMDPISPHQCQALNTDNCQISPVSKNCAPGYGFIAACSADASNIEIEFFFTKIKRLNASRGLEITVHGKRTFPQETYASVADVLIILIVADFPDFHLSALRELELPIITHIQMIDCSNVVIKQDDLLFFPRLTMFVLARSTVQEIEEGAFDSLKHFQEVTFDTGFATGKPLPPAVMAHLRLLHCDCKYDWLRAFLKSHPNLLAPRQQGEVHTFGGILSAAFTMRQIFIPTDCSKPNLLGSSQQTEFTINTGCPSEIQGGVN